MSFIGPNESIKREGQTIASSIESLNCKELLFEKFYLVIVAIPNLTRKFSVTRSLST